MRIGRIFESHAPDGRSGFTVREFCAAALIWFGALTPFMQIPRTATDSHRGDSASSEPIRLQLGGATIEVTFGRGDLDLPRERFLAWISRAAQAVAHYYGVFPVPVMRVRIDPSPDRSGPFGGTTWGSHPPFTRVHVGRDTTEKQLRGDWLMTHEMIHTAFPDVDDDHHWIEEGIATYVEPIARVQVGELKPETIWGDMVRGMPQGEPRLFDKGLDHTHTWGRTYWGGALFCLLADVRIRQASQNRKGLQDALRGIRDAGGTIDHHWPVTRAFEAGDRATHTQVLSSQYADMKDKPVSIDLEDLWRRLGVNSSNGVVVLDDRAPLADVRRAITSGV